MPVMKPLTSDLNLTPSSTALVSGSAATMGAAVLGQMVATVGTVVVVMDVVAVVVVFGAVVGTVVVVVVVVRRVMEVVGTVVVDDVEEVDAPLSVTLITFDGPLSNGAPGLAAWLSATMATVSVSVCPAAGSATENVSVQGVAAQTTDAGWLPTWVQIWDAETKLSCVQMVASPRQSKTRYVSTTGSDEGSKLALREAARAALVPSAAPMSRPTSVRGQPPIKSSQSGGERSTPARCCGRAQLSPRCGGPRWHLPQSESVSVEFPRPEPTHPSPQPVGVDCPTGRLHPDVFPARAPGAFAPVSCAYRARLIVLSVAPIAKAPSDDNRAKVGAPWRRRTRGHSAGCQQDRMMEMGACTTAPVNSDRTTSSGAEA